MSSTTRSDAPSGPGRLGAELSEFVRELRHMGSLRRRLVEAEIRSDLAGARRLARVAVPAAVVALVGLGLLAMAGVHGLSRIAGWPVGVFAAIVGTAATLAGSAVAIGAYRRFRREFTGLRDSVDELKEDLLWIRDQLE